MLRRDSQRTIELCQARSKITGRTGLSGLLQQSLHGTGACGGRFAGGDRRRRRACRRACRFGRARGDCAWTGAASRNERENERQNKGAARHWAATRHVVRCCRSVAHYQSPNRRSNQPRMPLGWSAHSLRSRGCVPATNGNRRAPAQSLALSRPLRSSTQCSSTPSGIR